MNVFCDALLAKLPDKEKISESSDVWRHDVNRTIAAVILMSASGLAQDLEFSGFADARYGIRTGSDPHSGNETLNELRIQTEYLWYHDLFTMTARTDFLYDNVPDSRNRLNLETGSGPIDLREFNLLFSPTMFMDVKAGRQILTWGTGDLLFINDLFPKDWKSFFSGRAEEYLKSPSDAVLISMFSDFANIDIAYTPRFDADRFVDGERFSYWDGTGLTGTTLKTERPDNWINDDEIAVRMSRNINGWETALYGYHGFWKTPMGFNPRSGKNTFPKLSVYGASMRGVIGGGIAKLEGGYYDSQKDRSGKDPYIPNSQIRLLTGYEHEIVKNLTGSVQYYIEHTMDHSRYLENFSGLPGTEADENRHVLTVRLTQMLMDQNLTLGLFTYWSPSDRDGYLRPSAAYKLSDNWLIEARGNIFFGEHNQTFFGQFEDNSNVSLAMRYSF